MTTITDNKIDTEESRVFLEEIFYVLSKKNSVFRVRLTDKGLALRREGGGVTREQIIPASGIIGCKCMRSKRRGGSCTCSAVSGSVGPSLKVVEENSGDRDESDVSAYLYIYAYLIKKTRKGGKRERTTVTLRFRSFDSYEENNKEAHKWQAAVKRVAQLNLILRPGLGAESRKLLVIVNPKSGKGKGREHFQRHAATLLGEAELPYELVVTEGALHAKRLVRTRNVYQYRGVLVCGGDGIFFEVLNGIFERPDWKQVLKELPLGIMPCGSGNGLARTLCYLYDEPYTNPILSCTFAAVRGKTTPMDIVRVETNTQIMFSFLSVGWGLLSDIDIESERLRAIGGQRFTIWSLARLMGLRTYKGKLYYRPVPAPPTSPRRTIPNLPHSISQDNSLDSCNDCVHMNGSCENCTINQITLDTKEELSPSSGNRRRLDSWYSAKSERSAYFSSAGSDYHSVADSSKGERDYSDNVCVYGPAPSLPALTAPLPPSWKCIEGEFIMVHAGYQTHLGEDFLFAPDSQLCDGVIWLLVIKGNTSRAQLLSFLLGISNGTHANPERQNPDGSILLIPVSAFRIEPEAKPSHPAHLTVDGELVSYGPIQAEMCSVQANLYVPSR